ncbi:MAG: D-alanyl-D-alanine carboxypeptidase family protein [Eubacteriales bacterium]|nr:D-alanyl-D-alanine carboxypeptidase family protein [Eubacteriales bacterium]
MRVLRHIYYRLICVLLVSAFLCPVFSVRSFALENWANDCHVASEGACLMDADSNTVLFEKNGDEAYYPASITKVMTALITLENCDNLSEQVTFSYDAVHIEEENSVTIGASEGDKLSVLDCLYSLLFQSANEVANALAEHVGAKHPELKEEGMNDRTVFVKMMNMKAEELGCKGSHFNNPSGLTDENHYVTAHDMCLIMAAAIKNDMFLDIESHTYWTHAPIRRYPDANDPWNTVYPKHSMLKRNSSQFYSGTIAGKTGYTMTAGNTLVTACRRDGMTLVTCVLNAHANHYNDTRRLFDFGFNNFSSLVVTDYDNANSVIAGDYQIDGITLVDSLTLGISPDTRIVIPKGGSFVEVKKTLDIENASGSGVLGRLVYTYGSRVVGTAELKLMNIGDSAELNNAAKTDPVLAGVMGIEIETEAAAENTESVQAAEASSAETESVKMPEEEKTSGGIISRITKAVNLKIAALIAGGSILVFIILTIIKAIIEGRQDARRARRRNERMRRTVDMTGTQQIRMDLEMQRRRTGRAKKRRR